MIFPKQQMKIEQNSSQDLKRQALQLIISLYLQRKKDEDIAFLHSNFKTTPNFIQSINSSGKHGLSQNSVKMNKLVYGENQKYPPRKCLPILQCLKNQFINLYVLINFFLLLACFIYTKIKSVEQVSRSVLTIVILGSFINFAKGLMTYLHHKSFQKTSIHKTKNKVYQVIRDSNLLELEQSQIVVGDVIELGFKEKVPVTGIMLSSKEIYVRERDKQESVRPKANIQTCLEKIKNMSNLDLKLSYQQQTLPSPIILRGSQLIQGKTYSIMAISVTQQNLLNSYGYACEDPFSNIKYDQWSSNLINKWVDWSIYLIAVAIVTLTFTQYTEMKLQNVKQTSENIIFAFLNILLEIGVIFIVLNPAYLRMFLDLSFIKLLTNVKVIQNFGKYFTADRIICNQRNIVDHDQIRIYQIALCQNDDLITPSQTQNTNMITHQIIVEICKIFGLATGELPQPIKINKINKIVHVYQKMNKIISVLSNQHPCSKNPIPNNVLKQTMKNKYQMELMSHSRTNSSEYRNNLITKKTQQRRDKIGSLNLLKLPQLHRAQDKQEQNLKQIINSHCKIRSKSFLDNLVELAQKKLRTYYFLPFDLESLDKIRYVVVNGEVECFSSDQKQRMAMLAKKMKVVYGVTPIMVGFNEGPYNKRPLTILVGILGLTIKQNTQIINRFNQLQKVGVKSLIYASRPEEQQEDEERRILEEYKQRNWLKSNDSEYIYDLQIIKKSLKRLVCKQCWVSCCDCKQKIEEVSNIQYFIQIQNKIKVVYNANDQNLKFLQSSFKQLQHQPICINSSNQSAQDIAESIFQCLNFLQGLKRSVILYYAVVIVYFIAPVMLWLRYEQSLSPIHIGVSAMLLLFIFTIGMLFEINVPASSLKIIEKQPKIMNKEKTLFIYCTCFVLIVFTQLFNYMRHLLPQFYDHYDIVMKQYGLDPNLCKYGINSSMVGRIDNRYCSVPELQLQFTRLSTFISAYIYFCLWTVLILFHHNFKSIGASVAYAASFVLYFCLMQLAPQMLNFYSQGLAWQHLLIIFISIIITIGLGYIISLVLCKVPLIDYFNSQTESKIAFQPFNRYHYTVKLKQYNTAKLWKGLMESDKIN